MKWMKDNLEHVAPCASSARTAGGLAPDYETWAEHEVQERRCEDFIDVP
jgi:hypothetical protein